jgi:hypothetical protein
MTFVIIVKIVTWGKVGLPTQARLGLLFGTEKA